ncbi:hypothetical protein [Clostridium sp. 001]|uniref:hypothetical protein n=1 Tax=Clostridium sp. 001 TaxID=1970093 RepID=UPI001C2C3AB2|nr:hypothetical protein [Clostridium sp. 001]QXE19551.1 hypothetical protein B5S50_12375 [Clostridium sp. 001]QXE20007.1 hypothetical protein B5S50_14905 [Clostridium sp. 001]
MKYIKINNFYNKFDQPDYKGLDLNQICAGSQLYPPNVTYAIFATNEELTTLSADIVEITEADYTSEKTAIETKNKQNTQQITDRLSAVEVAVANMMGV